MHLLAVILVIATVRSVRQRVLAAPRTSGLALDPEG